MKKVWKECKPFKKDDFYRFIEDEYDNALISYGGRDYMFDFTASRHSTNRSWYFMDALEFLSERKPKPLAGPFDSLENLLKAPLLDGKSIDQRYNEIGTSDTFRIVEE